MKKKISFRMLAYTDPAGKRTLGAAREGNEDNYYADDNLCGGEPGSFVADQIVEMGEYGFLMVVADGMGGQNAGEVASQIAVNTVKEYFYPGKISERNATSHKVRGKYMEEVIKEADKRIKTDARHNPERNGMGSTIIMAWIVGNELTLSWCGDSRAYRYNPYDGIELISKDHSYVQELVDQGIITYDDTFDHPQGNIVTRSLGDNSQKMIPETKGFPLFKNDIILLCSDGLSGVLRDKKTYDNDGNLYPGENIEDIINENHASLVECRDALLKAAEEADWYDNVTIVMCEILDGIDTADNKHSSKRKYIRKHNNNFFSKTLNFTIKFTPKKIIILLIGLAAILLCAVIVNSNLHNNGGNNENNSANVTNDTLNSDKDVIDGVNETTILNENKVSLSREVAAIQTKLNQINSLTDSLNRLAENVDNATTQTELDSLSKQVKIWNYKADYLCTIYVEICNANKKNEKKRVKQLQTLFDNIKSDLQDNHSSWEQKLKDILKKDRGNNKGGDLPPDSELTESTDNPNPDEMNPEFPIWNKKNSSYAGIVATLERNNPGYKVKSIKLKTGEQISSQDDIEKHIPINEKKQAEAVLKKE